MGEKLPYRTSADCYQDGAFQFKVMTVYFLHYAVLSFNHLGAQTSIYKSAQDHEVFLHLLTLKKILNLGLSNNNNNNNDKNNTTLLLYNPCI